MMRDILFRGKSVETGEWEYGDLVHFRGSKLIYIHTTYGEAEIYREVEPDTVGQYTEQKDLNGNRIYEGDILQDPDDATLLKVEWDEDEASFYAYEIDGCWRYGANEMVCFDVVGNKWNDPELLRKMDKGE